MWSWTLAALVLSLTSLTQAALRDGRPHGNVARIPAVPEVSAPTEPVVDVNGTELPPLSTTYYFDQLIDHTKPSLGTFKQRYWHTWEWYKPGGPIILSTPGEGNAEGYTGYLVNRTINGQIAQQEHGATIVLEHRFYGLSNPYPDLSVKSLKYHTIQQAIDDLEYFAKNVKLAMPGGDAVTPEKAPWVLMGGSYSGALTGWTMVNKPGLFRAGYASSGVVEAIVDYWGYFEPIRQYMPKNCSADVEAVIAHVDKVFTSKNTTAINSIKSLFGLQDLSHLDDVAGALRNNLWHWQDLQPTTGPGGKFYEFCDALEVKDGVSAPASGWGLAHALQAWGNYWTTSYYEYYCGDLDAETCLGSYDPTQDYWNDISVDNSWRSWFWIVCNEVGFLQDGPPSNDIPAIVTRLVQPPYDERQCTYMFKGAWNKPPVPSADKVNAKYKGWNLKVDRLFIANGQRDPWREATVSADGLDIKSTSLQPIVVSDGFHCSDLSTSSAKVDATIDAVQKQALAAMHEWLTGFVPAKESKRGIQFTKEA